MNLDDKIDITILCKVIDNYGDIGFAYRLAKSLKEKNCKIDIRFIIDDIKTFSLLAPQVQPNIPMQICDNIKILDWNNDELCIKSFKEKQAQIILQCFQCGYPTWLENMLFSNVFKEVVNVINIDYLTAEKYAQDFHCLKSLTRSSRVKKVNFMPGFTNKTGSLIFDNNFNYNQIIRNSKNSKKNIQSILMFGYDRNYEPIVSSINKFLQNKNDTTPNSKVHIYSAKGQGQLAFLQACKKQKNEFNVEELQFISQSQWDKMLIETDILFIRGEDSLSRACLSGKPFIWQAYKQENEYHKVKVKALLECMREYFSYANFKILENAWLLYNSENCEDKLLENAIYLFLENIFSMKESFVNFAISLYKNGDFTTHLLSYLQKIIFTYGK